MSRNRYDFEDLYKAVGQLVMLHTEKAPQPGGKMPRHFRTALDNLSVIFINLRLQRDENIIPSVSDGDVVRLRSDKRDYA